MNWLPFIASAYKEGISETFPDIQGFQSWITDQFHRLPFLVEFVGFDPYPSLENMRAEIMATGRMLISNLNNSGVFDPAVNLQFRAVHDYDHLKCGVDFDFHGERSACKAILDRCADKLARQLLFSEIVAQTCAALHFGFFCEQRFVLFPDHQIDSLIWDRSFTLEGNHDPE